MMQAGVVRHDINVTTAAVYRKPVAQKQPQQILQLPMDVPEDLHWWPHVNNHAVVLQQRPSPPQGAVASLLGKAAATALAGRRK